MPKKFSVTPSPLFRSARFTVKQEHLNERWFWGKRQDTSLALDNPKAKSKKIEVLMFPIMHHISYLAILWSINPGASTSLGIKSTALCIFPFQCVLFAPGFM